MDSISSGGDTYGSGNSGTAGPTDDAYGVKEESHSSLSYKMKSATDETPRKVRDLINLFNFTTEQKVEVAEAKPNCLKASEAVQLNQAVPENCGELVETNVQNQDDEIAISTDEQPFAYHLVSTKDKTSMRQIVTGQHQGKTAIETSFYSKTKIIKTEGGLRVTIDIFSEKHSEHEDADMS